jgi:uncharacterized protein YlzI (FlbEa/FlbD family)
MVRLISVLGADGRLIAVNPEHIAVIRTPAPNSPPTLVLASGVEIEIKEPMSEIVRKITLANSKSDPMAGPIS